MWRIAGGLTPRFMHVNPFDRTILQFLNGFAQRSWAFDALINLMSWDYLLKGVPVVGLFWWLWSSTERSDRETLFSGLISSFVAVNVARVLALTLRYRERPLHNPSLHFRLPYQMDPQTLLHYSSFPSDHMVLYTCLATTLVSVDRRVGSIALAYTLLAIGFPRVYLGIHYPSDVLAGALLGLTFAWLSQTTIVQQHIGGLGLRWLNRHAGSFYAFLFVVTFETAENFNGGVDLLRYGVHLWQRL
jgi:undecaprenyl-diphosphatase